MIATPAAESQLRNPRSRSRRRLTPRQRLRSRAEFVRHRAATRCARRTGAHVLPPAPTCGRAGSRSAVDPRAHLRLTSDPPGCSRHAARPRGSLGLRARSCPRPLELRARLSRPGRSSLSAPVVCSSLLGPVLEERAVAAAQWRSASSRSPTSTQHFCGASSSGGRTPASVALGERLGQPGEGRAVVHGQPLTLLVG